MTEPPPSSTERPLDTPAIALVLLLCLTWGFNQVVVKLLLPEIPPLMQAFLRSLGGLAVILLVALVRRVSLLTPDGTLRAGLWAGTLFGIEFIFLYSGLLWTTASRASVFLYTAPFFVAFGSYRYLGERLSRLQWAGLALSFVGVAVAIGVPQPNVDAKVMLGDAFMIAAGSLWAATTLIVKASRLRHAPAEKGLAYQLVVSLPILGAASLIGGESIGKFPETSSILLMLYQAVWVVGATFLLWFGMIKTYSASKLSAFTFVTPLFGVAAGYFILNEPLTAAFGGAAVLVTAGLYLVNRPAPHTTDPLLKLPKT
ncbi:MAG: DMT family transporter [Rhizobiales bacterium]|nr:DMT family transporter [Hyphomicrobiales bacterium]